MPLGTLPQEQHSTFIPSQVKSPTYYVFRQIIVRKVILLLSLDPEYRQTSLSQAKTVFQNPFLEYYQPVSAHCHWLQTILFMVIKIWDTSWCNITLSADPSLCSPSPIKAATITMETTPGRSSTFLVKPSMLSLTESSGRRSSYLSKNGYFNFWEAPIAFSHCFLPMKL